MRLHYSAWQQRTSSEAELNWQSARRRLRVEDYIKPAPQLTWAQARVYNDMQSAEQVGCTRFGPIWPIRIVRSPLLPAGDDS